VAALAASAATREAMRRRTRASVAERTWEAIGDQLLAHYASVIDGRARTGAAA
jgi:phosphatidylinositol alpha 1,6-mannosyltransferase